MYIEESGSRELLGKHGINQTSGKSIGLKYRTSGQASDNGSTRSAYKQSNYNRSTNYNGANIPTQASPVNIGVNRKKKISREEKLEKAVAKLESEVSSLRDSLKKA